MKLKTTGRLSFGRDEMVKDRGVPRIKVGGGGGQIQSISPDLAVKKKLDPDPTLVKQLESDIIST